MKNNMLRTTALLTIAILFAITAPSCKKDKKDEGNQRTKLLGTEWIAQGTPTESEVMEFTKDGELNLLFLPETNRLPHGKLSADGKKVLIDINGVETVFVELKLDGEILYVTKDPELPVEKYKKINLAAFLKKLKDEQK